VHGPEPERLVLAATPRAAGLARAFVAAVLDRWGSSHLADATVLLTSELVTNALVHADSPSTLTLEPEQPGGPSLTVEGVRVSVADSSQPVLAGDGTASPRRPVVGCSCSTSWPTRGGGKQPTAARWSGSS
jgi:hypothetical protein